MTTQPLYARLALLLSLIAIMACTPAAMAQRNKVAVGEPAPGFDIETWFNTDTGIEIEKDRMYIIEFFETDCGPCVSSMRYLAELRDNHAYARNLVVIGIATDTKRDDLDSYLKRYRGVLNYPIGLDRRTSTRRAWMQAAGRETIPTTFVIDYNGVIQWIGNTVRDNDSLNEILPKVASGRYDAKVELEIEDVVKAAETARRVGNYRMAHKHYDDVIAHNTFVNAPYALEKFEMMLVDQDDTEGAYAYLQTLMTQNYAADDQLLMMIARKLTLDRDIPVAKRNTDVALAAAMAASALQPGDPAAKEVVARVHFERGEFREAVAIQRRAWMAMPPTFKDDSRRILLEYQTAARRESSR